MAEFQLERLTLDDDRALHGLSSGLDKGQIAIHVHGTWGNFYENTIATAFADLYASFGYGFATVNVPGHDSESTSEVFEESLQALALWAHHLAPTGNILWQAHSLGALKVV